MPRGQKNVVQRSVDAGAPKAKRAKVEVDPVQQKIAVVCEALSNKEYAVPGPESCRAMLCAAAPAALATLQGERHDYQKALFGMIDEVFESAWVLFQSHEAQSQAVFDTAQKEQEAREATKAAALEEVMTKKNEITEKQQVASLDASAVQEAKAKVHEAEEQKSGADASWQALGIEQDRCQELIQGAFQMLKDGSWENPRVQKQKLAAVKSYVQKNLSLDKSALDSMSTVFSKKPEERGGFDNMVVDQFTGSLAKHIEALGEQRNGAAALVAEKATMVEQFGAMVESAQEKQQGSKAAVAAAEMELTNLTGVLADAQKAVKDNEKTTKQALADLACQKSRIKRLQGDREAFAFLRARAVVPEPREIAQNVAEFEVVPEPCKAAQNTAGSKIAAPQVSKMMEPLAAAPAAGTMVAAGA